jgi:hypothetical protein
MHSRHQQGGKKPIKCKHRKKICFNPSSIRNGSVSIGLSSGCAPVLFSANYIKMLIHILSSRVSLISIMLYTAALFLLPINPINFLEFDHYIQCFINFACCCNFLNFIQNHQSFYRACLNKRNSFPIEAGFGPLWNRAVIPNALQKGITSEEEMMYYFVFYQAGITMCLKRWVDHGCQEPPEQICRYFMNCLPNTLPEF